MDQITDTQKIGHSQEILAALGYGTEEIAAIRGAVTAD